MEIFEWVQLKTDKSDNFQVRSRCHSVWVKNDVQRIFEPMSCLESSFFNGANSKNLHYYGPLLRTIIVFLLYKTITNDHHLQYTHSFSPIIRRKNNEKVVHLLKQRTGIRTQTLSVFLFPSR